MTRFRGTVPECTHLVVHGKPLGLNTATYTDIACMCVYHLSAAAVSSMEQLEVDIWWVGVGGQLSECVVFG